MMNFYNRRELMNWQTILDNKVVVGVLIAVFGFLTFLVFGPEVGADLLDLLGLGSGGPTTP